jgi:mono/diheme cytochrome c family protein
MRKNILVPFLITLWFCACKSSPESSVLSPEESLKHMQVEDGFSVELVAAEPLVVAPVAMTFDEFSRIWVVEMQGYMPDTLGSGEDMRTGKIVILEDTDQDGRADTRKVFLDSLILPRAICLIENGVLVAEPPYLWFVERNGDTAGRKILVDDKYAEGGNVEHQPNGLLRNIDNWIYNAKSSFRYKKKDSVWLKVKTHFRGQWGISNDDYGRLYYNHNSANVLGDYFFPSLGFTNDNLTRVAGFNEKIVADNRVYPIHPTTGVNRGYMEGILDSTGRLVNFTAACGPLVYRGDLFSEEYYNNAFVPEPAANLIKRNILDLENFPASGRQAYQDKEFLASDDERFRPVNCFNGPDGALYFVDMYRGIIQHKTYLTDYLKGEIRQRELTHPLSCGRIYRVVPKGKKVKPFVFPKEATELIKLFDHPNGWIREKAQQLYIDHFKEASPLLREYADKVDKPVTALLALWTLAEYNALKPGQLKPLLSHQHPAVRQAALSMLPEIMTKENYNQPIFNEAYELLKNDSVAAPLVVFIANKVAQFDKRKANAILTDAVRLYPNNRFVADAVLSNLQDKEHAFQKTVAALQKDTATTIHRQLNKLIAALEQSKNDASLKAMASKYPRGMNIYKNICQTCHGADGNGMTSLAPPLNRSDWVTGDKDRLAAIILYGLTGPVQVNGRNYKSPEVLDEMPGIASNDELNDEDIAQLINFIRNAWSNKAEEVKASDVERVRRKYAGRQKSFTADELQKK